MSHCQQCYLISLANKDATSPTMLPNTKSAFTLGVRDSSAESIDTIIVILRLKLTYHENFNVKLTFT